MDRRILNRSHPCRLVQSVGYRRQNRQRIEPSQIPLARGHHFTAHPNRLGILSLDEQLASRLAMPAIGMIELTCKLLGAQFR